MTEEETRDLDERHAGKTEEKKSAPEPAHIGSSEEAFRKAEEERVRRLNTPSKDFEKLATGAGMRRTMVLRGQKGEAARAAALAAKRKEEAERPAKRAQQLLSEKTQAETALLREQAKKTRAERKRERRRALSGAFATRPEEQAPRPITRPVPKRFRKRKRGKGKVVVHGSNLTVRNFDEKRGSRRAKRLER